MRWTAFQTNWPLVIERIVGLWPETDRETLKRLNGSYDEFAAYLARVHHLTRAEACEVIEGWLVPSVAHNPVTIAAS
jgi:hypothetical protein